MPAATGLNQTTPTRGTHLLGIPLTGRRVALERLALRHLDALYAISKTDGVATGWPLLGRDVSHEQFPAYLAGLSSLQFAVTRRDTGDTVGLVQAVDESQRNRSADLGFVMSIDLWRSGWPLEGIVLFADLLFRGFGYRKLYLSAPESVKRRMGSTVENWLTTEVVLRQHVRLGDAYEDLTILTLDAAHWDVELVRKITGNH